MNQREMKKRLMISSKGDLADRLIMAYSTIAKLEERCLTIVEPDTTKIQVVQQDGFSNGGAG